MRERASQNEDILDNRSLTMLWATNVEKRPSGSYLRLEVYLTNWSNLVLIRINANVGGNEEVRSVKNTQYRPHIQQQKCKKARIQAFDHNNNCHKWGGGGGRERNPFWKLKLVYTTTQANCNADAINACEKPYQCDKIVLWFSLSCDNLAFFRARSSTCAGLCWLGCRRGSIPCRDISCHELRIFNQIKAHRTASLISS